MITQNKALIIDDSEDVCELLKVLLGLNGYETFVFHTATQAIAEVSKITPDLVFLDMSLPDMFGTETAMRLQKECCDPLNIVALTGLYCDDIKSDLISSGIKFYMQKPFTNGKLKQLLDEIRQKTVDSNFESSFEITSP